GAGPAGTRGDGQAPSADPPSGDAAAAEATPVAGDGAAGGDGADKPPAPRPKSGGGGARPGGARRPQGQRSPTQTRQKKKRR
ncbi:MAG TPA: hypothetical protein VE547_04490, partial [Mycobacteriales bacterium]|nr:hypothetical protein [Mycobacteriales bacterium]